MNPISKRIIVLSACLPLVTGCADKSQNVQSSYASPLQYQSYSCRQLSEEAARISGKVSQLAGIQDKNASNDAVAVGVTMIVFWPALFFLKGNKETKAELARMKGEMDAIEQASIKKNCGIVFQKAPLEAPKEKEVVDAA
jgi:hypothetical protein